MERVRLWWGIVGSISDATGHFEREPIAEDAWLATELDIYFHVRVLFRTTRRGETTHWDQFELVAERSQPRLSADQLLNARYRQPHLAVDELR